MDPLNNFLKKSKFEQVNKCVVRKCKEKDCSNEKNFLPIVERCFIKEKGKVHMRKHIKQDKCEQQFNLRPTSAYWYIDQEQSYRNFWRLFFKGNSASLKEVTECIFEKEKLFSANMTKDDMVNKLSRVKIDKFQDSVDSCFQKVYGKVYTEEQIQRTSCAYKYFVFDPMTKGQSGSCFGGCQFHNTMQLNNLLKDQTEKLKNL